MDPIIILLRILTPLSIFHFPLIGAITSLWLDGIDWSVNFFNIPNIHANYVLLDKILDIYYLSIEAYVLLKWKSVTAKKIALGLFLLRMTGVLLLALTGWEGWLFIFPNVFENFFLFYLSVKFLLKKEPDLSAAILWVSVVVLAIPKLIQEYVMHIALVTNWRAVAIPGTTFVYDNLYTQLVIVVLLIFTVAFIQKKGHKTQKRKT